MRGAEIETPWLGRAVKNSNAGTESSIQIGMSHQRQCWLTIPEAAAEKRVLGLSRKFPNDMANILVTCGIADGHVLPFLAVVRGLVQKGHHLLWLGGRKYQTRIEETGARFAAVPIECDPNGRSIYDYIPGLTGLEGIQQVKVYMRQFVKEWIPYMDAIESIRSKFDPDIFVCDPVMYGTAAMAEKLKKPCINVSVLPLILMSRDHAPFGAGFLPGGDVFSRCRNRFLNYVVDYILLRDVMRSANQIRAKLGLPPYRGLLRDINKYHDRVMAATIPSFDYARSDLPSNVSYIGSILPEADPCWQPPDWWADLEAAKAVVLVNQGTIALDTQDLIVPALQALREENMLIVAVPMKERNACLPVNARGAEFLPFAHLLPHVDVMVTNGGYGGTQQALAHGIPLVVAGTTEDKIEVALRVELSGAGINLRTRKPTPEMLRKAVKEVLANARYKRQAIRMQSEMKQYNPVALIAKAVDELVENQRAAHVAAARHTPKTGLLNPKGTTP